MRAYIVQDERMNPIGVYFDEHRALNAQSVHEKRHPHGRATISTHDTDRYEVFVLSRDGEVIGVYSTLDNLKAAASVLPGICSLGSFILDAPPLDDDAVA